MDIEEFSNNFEGTTQPKLIQEIHSKSYNSSKYLINKYGAIAQKSAKKREKHLGKSKARNRIYRTIKYLNRIGYINISNDNITVNKSFIPKSQR